MARNHLQREEAQARINAQLPLSQKCQAATVVINNQGDQVALQKQVTELMRQVTEAMAWVCYNICISLCEGGTEFDLSTMSKRGFAGGW